MSSISSRADRRGPSRRAARVRKARGWGRPAAESADRNGANADPGSGRRERSGDDIHRAGSKPEMGSCSERRIDGRCRCWKPVSLCDARADRLEIGDHHIDAAGIEAADVGVESEKIQTAGRLEILQPSTPGGKGQTLPGDKGFERLHVPEQRRISPADDHFNQMAVGFQMADDFTRTADVARCRCPGLRIGSPTPPQLAATIPARALRQPSSMPATTSSVMDPR